MNKPKRIKEKEKLNVKDNVILSEEKLDVNDVKLSDAKVDDSKNNVDNVEQVDAVKDVESKENIENKVDEENKEVAEKVENKDSKESKDDKENKDNKAKSKTPMSKAKKKKIVQWTLTGFFLSVLVVVGSMKAYEKITGTSCLGTQYPVVLTDSMVSRDKEAYPGGYNVEDVLVIHQKKEVEPLKDEEGNILKDEKGNIVGVTIDKNVEVKVGDDISFNFKFSTLDKKVMVTHRLYDIQYSETGWYIPNTHTDKSNGFDLPNFIKDYEDYDLLKLEEKGKYKLYPSDDKPCKFLFVTHGINTESHQQPGEEGKKNDCTKQYQYFFEDDLIGKVLRKSNTLTALHKVFASVWTLIILVLVPALYIVITSIIDLFDAVKTPETEEAGDKNKTKKKTKPYDPNNPLGNLSKEDVDALKKEMLDELIKDTKKGEK